MLTTYEVGAVFRVLDSATGPLRKILESVTALNKAITATRNNLKGLGVAPGLGAAIAETDSLAAAWTKVGVEAAAAAKVVAASAASSARSAAAAATSVPSVAPLGMGGRHRPGWLGGSGAHITGPGVPLTGGSHLRLGGTAEMVGAGALAFGVYEDAELLKDIHWINYHLGRKDTKENIAEVRKIIEDAMTGTTMPMRDIAKAATEEARLLKGTPGESSGAAALPEFLRAAAAEALAKDTSVQESMKAIVGLAHMTKAYSPAEIRRLFPAFAYLSTANPAGLKEMEKSFSYAVPILQSGADIDPISTMLLGTALSTAGVTSSKSGTWLREMAIRGMPGNAEHNEMLKRFGLIDANGKPTWFTNGKPDPAKLLEIGAPRAAAMPPEERLPAEMELFGRRGGGAFAVLGDERVLARIKELRKEMGSEAFQNRYGSILEDYKGTAVGTARTTLAEFNIALMRLGDTALPMATSALKGFSTALGWFGGGHKTQEDKTFTPSWMERFHELMPWSGASALPKPQPQLEGAFGGPSKDWKAPNPNFLQGPTAPPKMVFPPITLNLNVDGQTLAHAVTDAMGNTTGFTTQAPAADDRSGRP